jgi:hypothetical protein
MSNDYRDLSMRADRLGIIASALCFVHCILTPVLLSMSAVWVHYLPSEEKFHRGLAVAVAAIGGFALVRGYRKYRRARVLLLMGCGLSSIFAGAYWGDHLPSHSAEVAVTMTGSCLMIAAHFINHTFCRNCDRCDKTEANKCGRSEPAMRRRRKNG